MLPFAATVFRAVAILAFELAAFFFFYTHPHGRRAVYFSWYAWVIDVFAIASGLIIMGSSVYALHNPAIFTISVPREMLWILFVVGSWQATIHFVKVCIRTFTRWKKQQFEEKTNSHDQHIRKLPGG